MKIAYFDCFSGISGDMTIAALLDAGLSFDRLSKELAKLKIGGYRLKASKVERGGIVGTKFDCEPASGTRGGHRSLKEIISMIGRSALSARAKDAAKEIFQAIGRAERKVHGIAKKADVVFSELGDIDSIIDIVGTAVAIDELGIDEVHASKVNTGRARTRTRHGGLPIPAPASLELLKGIPTEMSGAESELVTPTGAGILKALSSGFGRMPAMTISDIGYGAGAKELSDMPNMLRVMIGQSRAAFKRDRIMVIETNIDDMSPQNFEYLFEKMFKEGAIDVYTTAVQMKKSRPAFKLTVLTDPARLERIASVIFTETTTIGMRYYETSRFILDRKFVKVKTRFGTVNVKLSTGPDGIFTASPEYEECADLARTKNIPLKIIYDEAKRAVKV